VTVDDAAQVSIRDAGEADLHLVAALHVQAFPTSVLGALGVEAVRRNYQWQLNGPHDLTAIVAESDGKVTGFLFGGVFRGSTIGFIKREKWFLLRRVVTRPKILLRSVGWRRLALGLRLLVRRTGPAQAEAPDSVPRRSFGVLAIAVDPTLHGQGVGNCLMSEARRRAIERGFRAMHLSVHPSNAKALSFYRGLGWTELTEPDGTWIGRMTTSLPEPG
jgi:ribosomal protein S18 acetylase RimI-like enzyme